MLSQLHSFRIHKPARTDFLVYFRRIFAQKVPVIPFYETHFHTLALFRLQRIAFATQIIAHLQFCICTQRKKATSQDILPQSPKKIRLVFLFIISGNYIYFPVPFFQTGIMSGSDVPAIQPVRPFRKDAELKQRVAHHTRIGRPPLPVFVNKVPDNHFAESLALICHIMLNAHALGKLTGFRRLVAPHPHRKADNFVPLLPQHQTCSGTINTTAHSNQHSLLCLVHIPDIHCLVYKNTGF